MTVEELITALQKLPKDSGVFYVYADFPFISTGWEHNLGQYQFTKSERTEDVIKSLRR
jgi:hypothetical protein